MPFRGWAWTARRKRATELVHQPACTERSDLSYSHSSTWREREELRLRSPQIPLLSTPDSSTHSYIVLVNTPPRYPLARGCPLSFLNLLSSFLIRLCSPPHTMPSSSRSTISPSVSAARASASACFSRCLVTFIRDMQRRAASHRT